jgi:hypothetical protein
VVVRNLAEVVEGELKQAKRRTRTSRLEWSPVLEPIGRKFYSATTTTNLGSFLVQC